MLVKVCGLKIPEQIIQLDSLVDFVGFIFYRGSPRYVSELPTTYQARRVGVFVNTEIGEILQQVLLHDLDYVQLHGDESPEICAKVSSFAEVIKAFGIHRQFNFDQLERYSNHVSYFLFDSKTINHGGSGKQFDWDLLKQYKLSVPFILSGGISTSSVNQLKQFQHPFFAGIDLNSGFEVSPADKNISLIQSFLHDVTYQ